MPLHWMLGDDLTLQVPRLEHNLWDFRLLLITNFSTFSPSSAIEAKKVQVKVPESVCLYGRRKYVYCQLNGNLFLSNNPLNGTKDFSVLQFVDGWQ